MHVRGSSCGFLMVYILGASSLHHAIEAWKRCKRRHLFDSNIIAIPGLHLNRQSRAQHKLVQVIQNEVSADEGFILWHDAINNSIGKHPVDPRPPLSPEELVSELKNLKGLCGIVYCQRSGTKNIYSYLAVTGIPVLNLLKDLLSKRKQKDQKLLAKYQELHQDYRLEIKSLTFLRSYGGDIRLIRNKRLRLSKTRRDKGLK